MGGLLESEYVATLETIGGGAAVELFNKEWPKLLSNIADPNTMAKAKRKITIEITVAPMEDRSAGLVNIDVKSKLVPHIGESTKVFFGMVEGRRQAVESNPTQGKLFDKPSGKVVSMAAKEDE